MTADFRNESLKLKAASMTAANQDSKLKEASTQFEPQSKEATAFVDDLYERVKEASDGNLEKRLFVCA
jgi:hypothetical protein